MESFHQFWDRINGPMYKNVPPPVKYNLAKYMDGTAFNNTHELTPLSHEDTATYAAEDVAAWYAKYGKNTTNLGSPMSDSEFKKHYGFAE